MKTHLFPRCEPNALASGLKRTSLNLATPDPKPDVRPDVSVNGSQEAFMGKTVAPWTNIVEGIFKREGAENAEEGF